MAKTVVMVSGMIVGYVWWYVRRYELLLWVSFFTVLDPFEEKRLE